MPSVCVPSKIRDTGKMDQGTASGVSFGKGSGGKQLATGQTLLALATFALTGAVFALDLWLPSIINASVTYAVPVLLGCQSTIRRFAILSGVLATTLCIAAYFLSVPATTTEAALANRGLALFAIWAVVIITARARQARGKLEYRIASRTVELRETRAALARAERLAVTGQLTGMVAHELRNPLGVIATSIAVVETRTRGANLRVEAALARASRGIGRCETIITEHLDFARAHGHKPVSLILDYWLSSVLDEMTIADDIILNRNLRAGGAVVRFDPETLRRALINIVDNACQAIAARLGVADAEHRLTVTSHIEGDSVLIVVADNGPGIPPDILARITEPLYSTKASGTGLGLPVVQRIMDEHGASLRIDSTPGQGTQVILRLPHADQS